MSEQLSPIEARKKGLRMTVIASSILIVLVTSAVVFLMS